MRACSIGAPAGYTDLLGPEAPEIPARATPMAGAEFTHLFADQAARLSALLPAILETMARDGMVWVSWPKRAAKRPTDIREDTIRDIALPLGLVDVKVCAVDAVWSGLKLVIRRENR